ncbi:MAG: ABC transporter substrate-binding protein [Deltaproteobacteria bacterium]|nr:ABC transporter substrate-binding protein [Deltaproteobacteria bacterium]
MKKIYFILTGSILIVLLTGFICSKRGVIADEKKALQYSSKTRPDVKIAESDKYSAEAEEFLKFWEKNINTKDTRALIHQLSLLSDKIRYEEIKRLITVTHGEAKEVLRYRLIRLYLHFGEMYILSNEIREFRKEFPNSVFIKDISLVEKKIQNIINVSPNKIGVLLPVSGKYKNFGEQFIKNIELFQGFLRVENPDENDLRYVSSDGIEFVFRDTEGEESKVEQAINDLIMKENVIAILGPVFLQESQKAAYISNKFKVPVIILSRKDDITETGEYVFRNCLTNKMQATYLARYAIEKLKFETFGIIYPNNSYGVELTNYFWDEVERNNKEITGVEYYEVDQTTFTAPARKITGKFYPELRTKKKNEEIELPKWAEGLSGARLEALLKKMKSNFPPIVDFEALFIPDYYDKVSLVVPAVAYEDVMFTNAGKKELENAQKVLGVNKIKPVQLLGANGWNSEELIRRMGKYAENALFIDGFFPDSENEATKKYVTEYLSRYHSKPNLIDSQFYDSILITLHLLRNKKPQTREEFRDALKNVQGLTGSAGEIKITSHREIVRPLKILTVKDQTITEIDEIRF